MNTTSVPQIVVTIRQRVTLEPELQAEIGSMPPSPRRALARKFKRWAHQLEISAKILETNSATIPPPKQIRWLHQRKARLN